MNSRQKRKIKNERHIPIIIIHLKCGVIEGYKNKNFFKTNVLKDIVNKIL